MALCLAGLWPGVACGDDEDGARPQVTAGATAVPSTAPVMTSEPAEGAEGNTLSAQEVAMHGTVDDCWLIINNKVYDVSGYLKSHPGGTRSVAPYCAKESTEAFEAIDHSPLARSHLGSIYVGDLAP